MTWALSALTLLTMWLAGGGATDRRWAWRISLVNQCLWLTWILIGHHWGLLPMNVGLFVVAIRNIRRNP